MTARLNFGTVVDFGTLAATIVDWRTNLTPIKAAGHPGKGNKTRPRPFSVVMRLGHGRGTRYVVAGSFARLGNAARKVQSLRGIAAWICLAPGYTMQPLRAGGAR